MCVHGCVRVCVFLSVCVGVCPRSELEYRHDTGECINRFINEWKIYFSVLLVVLPSCVIV